MLLIFNVFVVPVYTMSQDPKKILFVLKSGLGFTNNIVIDSSLLLMLLFFGNYYFE